MSDPDAIELIIKSANKFYNGVKADPNGRYRSWEYCYKCFYDARNTSCLDYDYLSLQLAFYLASWGMYRGSSFLLQKDYKVHIPVVGCILKNDYDCLFGLECVRLRRDKTIQDRLLTIQSEISDYYKDIRGNVKEKEVKSNLSNTLITKVLMGTLGCVPAYDRYFIDGVKHLGFKAGNYSQESLLKSLLKLVDFYENNRGRLEEIRKNLKVCDSDSQIH